jgi:hypothetical protein
MVDAVSNPQAGAKQEVAVTVKVEPLVSDEEKLRLLQMSEISLWLDGYDDIFSDFDPRQYSERSLSDDFLREAQKAAREKVSGVIDLKFLIPAAKRDVKLEDVIKKRLHEHFKKHHQSLEGEVRRLRVRGIMWAFLGMFLMMVSTFIRMKSPMDFGYQFLVVVFEPGGWFVTWFGLDQIFYAAGGKKAELEFYGKMSKCVIHFITY